MGVTGDLDPPVNPFFLNSLGPSRQVHDKKKKLKEKGLASKIVSCHYAYRH